ncbi:MAG: class I SAM-dependent methyltransferase [Planctomycetota bacterium]|nr:class I SAM-dependent methyltransferase [Planctomycetota bacterium]
MKRFFSLPRLQRRRDIKQFEKDVYDSWADTYDRSIWTTWLNKWVDSFAEDIPQGCSMLDIGCGTGAALLRLSRRNPLLLAGIDISPKAIAVAKDKLSGLPADLRVADAETQLPWIERCGFQFIEQKRVAFLARCTIAQKPHSTQSLQKVDLE